MARGALKVDPIAEGHNGYANSYHALTAWERH
jgi:hypothetical protein